MLVDATATAAAAAAASHDDDGAGGTFVLFISEYFLCGYVHLSHIHKRKQSNQIPNVTVTFADVRVLCQGSILLVYETYIVTKNYFASNRGSNKTT